MANLEMREEVAMPLLSADPVMVSPEHREVVERLVRTRSTPQQLALRARMILQVADGMGVRASARELGVWPKAVRSWGRRWRGPAALERGCPTRRRRDRPQGLRPSKSALGSR